MRALYQTPEQAVTFRSQFQKNNFPPAQLRVFGLRDRWRRRLRREPDLAAPPTVGVITSFASQALSLHPDANNPRQDTSS